MPSVKNDLLARKGEGVQVIGLEHLHFPFGRIFAGGALRPKDNQEAGIRIKPKFLLGHRRKPVVTLPEVYGLRRYHNPAALYGDDHRTALRAEASSATRRAFVSTGSRRMAPLTSNSILTMVKCGSPEDGEGTHLSMLCALPDL